MYVYILIVFILILYIVLYFRGKIRENFDWNMTGSVGLGTNLTDIAAAKGLNIKRNDGSWTHFDWKDDGNNYITGDTTTFRGGWDGTKHKDVNINTLGNLALSGQLSNNSSRMMTKTFDNPNGGIKSFTILNISRTDAAWGGSCYIEICATGRFFAYDQSFLHSWCRFYKTGCTYGDIVAPLNINLWAGQLTSTTYKIDIQFRPNNADFTPSHYNISVSYRILEGGDMSWQTTLP